MRREFVKILRCPVHREAGLTVHPGSVVQGDEIEEGGLLCTECGTAYPIESGIPSFLPSGLQDDTAREAVARLGQASGFDRVDPPEHAEPPDDGTRIMRSEMQTRDQESELYERLYDDETYRYELDTYVEHAAVAAGETVLDLGCGTGRVTKELIGSAKLIVAVDFSQASLVYLRNRLTDDQRGRVFILRSDAGALPLCSGSFDLVISTSLFSNLPTAEIRRTVLAEAHRCARVGARFLITVYNDCWTRRVRYRLGLSKTGLKEGFQSGGRIHYYNFDPDEFTTWVSTYFEPGPCFGLNHRVPVLSPLSGTLSRRLDRLLSGLPGTLRVFAKEMGMVAHKRAKETVRA